MKPVTDPALLEQLNAGSSQVVSDPDLLKQLEQEEAEPEGDFWEGTVKSANLGLRGLGRQVTNMMLPKSMEPEWATKEGIQQFEEESAEQFAKPGGSTGRFLGEAVGLAPTMLVGPLLGGAAKLAGSAGLARTAAGLAKVGQGAGASGAAGRAAIESGMAGSVIAGEDNRTMGALTGAGIGAGVGGGIHRLAKSLGKGTGVTPESVQLQERAAKAGIDDMFIPAERASANSVVRNVYGYLRQMPMAKKALNQEMNEGMDVFRTVAAREGMGEGATFAQITAKMTPEEQAGVLTKAKDQVYDVIKKGNYEASVFDDALDPMVQLVNKNKGNTLLKKEADKLIQEARTRITSGANGRISGHDLIQYKNELAEQASLEMAEAATRPAAIAKRQMIEVIDEMISKNLSRGGSGQQKNMNKMILDGWKNMRKIERELNTMIEAPGLAKGTGRGKYRAEDLSKLAQKKGAGSTKELADLGFDVMEYHPVKVPFEKLLGNMPYFAVMGLLSSSGVLPMVGGVAALGALGRGLATKTVQRGIMGQTAPQRALTKAVKQGSPVLREGVKIGATLPLTIGATRE